MNVKKKRLATDLEMICHIYNLFRMDGYFQLEENRDGYFQLEEHSHDWVNRKKSHLSKLFHNTHKLIFEFLKFI